MLRFSVVALCLFSVPAFAHVTANPDHGAAGSYFETSFRVSHGCEGTDTVQVSIQMPKGMIVAKPQAKAGWNIEIKKSKLDKPVSAGHGRMVDEQIDEIIWSGGALPNDHYDSFGVLIKLPETAGETLWFPVTQSCKKGEHKWVGIPAEGQQWHDVKSPAPFVKIEPAQKHAH